MSMGDQINLDLTYSVSSRGNDRPNMTSAVYHGRKALNPPKQGEVIIWGFMLFFFKSKSSVRTCQLES